MTDAKEQTGFESSMLANLSPQAQVGIVGTVVGVPTLAIIDAVIGLGEWAVLPEAAGLALAVLGARYYLKRHDIDMVARFKNLNWAALVSGDTEEDEGQPKDAQDTAQEDEQVQPLPSEPASARTVNLADTLHPDIDDIAGKSIFICGIRRSGKTTLGVRVAEEFGRFHLPMLIPDLKGDWLSLKDTLPHAVVWGKGKLTMAHARAVGYGIVERGMQLIFDIKSYGRDGIDEACEILAEMIEGIFEWEMQHPDDKRLCAVFLDEAQSFLPENIRESIILNAEIRSSLLRAYMYILAVGGSYGVFPVVMTQRIAQVNKKIIAQPELLFLLKQTMDVDLQRYKEFTDIPSEKIRGFNVGEGIYRGLDGESRIVTFHKRTSDDSQSSTPKYKERVLSPSPNLSQKTHKFSEYELEDLGEGEKVKEGESMVKQPQERRESGERFGESRAPSGEPFTAEQEQQIILAALAIAQSGNKVTRSAIKDRLGWNNKQYDALKAVCDKHNIGGN